MQEVRNGLEISPVLLAATFGALSRVKGLLLAEGVDASLRYSDRYKISALGAAALMGHLDVVRALLEHGVDVNDASPEGRTVLHNAVLHGRVRLDLIDLLLSAGADMEAPMVVGLTPLHLSACCRGSGGATAILLRRGAAKDAIGPEGFSPVHFAAYAGDLAAMLALLAAGVDASLRTHDDLKTAPLEVAAHRGRVEVVRELVRHGVDLDATDAGGYTALHLAAMANEGGVVDALVEAGASVTPETSGATPLHFAVQYICPDAMQVLLRHGVPFVETSQKEDGVDRYDKLPPLHLASAQAGKGGASQAVDLLLRWGADESELDDEGKTVAEVVGANQVQGDVLEGVEPGICPNVEAFNSAMTDADRVRELLANAPADKAWRRRGLLLLCLARDRLRRGRTRSGGKGKWKMKGKGVLSARDGGGGSGGSGSSSAVLSSRVGMGVSTATARRGKREQQTPSKAGDRRARYGGR